MKISISRDEMLRLTIHQLNNLFFISSEELTILSTIQDNVLLRCEKCFSHINCRYYSSGGETYFNPLHSDQHAIFLYFLCNSLYHAGYMTLAEKVYRLNKAMNGNDIYCTVELPEIFKIEHSIGTIIAPGTRIGNYFKISQNCTIGNNNGHLPIIGEHVYILSGSKIVGNCIIGDQVVVSANTYIKDMNIPSGSIVFPTFKNGRLGVNIRPLSEKLLSYNNITLFHE